MLVSRPIAGLWPLVASVIMTTARSPIPVLPLGLKLIQGESFRANSSPLVVRYGSLRRVRSRNVDRRLVKLDQNRVERLRWEYFVDMCCPKDATGLAGT